MAITSLEDRPVRIAGCSGCATDRRDAMQKLAAGSAQDQVDVIIGDWMSEANMTSRGVSKSDNPDIPAYEPTFLEALEPALLDLAMNKIKLAVNAGASDTRKLHDVVVAMIEQQGLDLKVAWISGDEVLPAIQQAVKTKSSPFVNVHTGEKLADWKHEPVYAQAYLGGTGIAVALAAGADIVVCGRVSDASLILGAAIWWHNWCPHHLDPMANALIAGHLIECSSYVCGGNFSGFRRLEGQGWMDIGYPIAEISNNGQVVITKNKGSGGEVSVETCTSQLLYEIQGPWYFNSDVTALINNISFEQLATNRVAMYGVTGGLPPPTTKVGITAKGGYQAEMHWKLVGLDIIAKAAMMETQIRRLMSDNSSNFSILEFVLNGTSPENPTSQTAATVDLRIIAQAPRAEDLAPAKFVRPCLDPIMCTYPGATPDFDLRTALPRPICEYFVTLMPQSLVHHVVHMPWITSASSSVVRFRIDPRFRNLKTPMPWAGRSDFTIEPPKKTKVWPTRQPSAPEALAELGSTPVTRARGGSTDAAGGWAELPAQQGRSVLRETFGPWGRTVRGPLGWVVHARSGDKGSDCNVGLFVDSKGDVQGKWEWLRNTMNARKMRDLLGQEYIISGKRRMERQYASGLVMDSEEENVEKRIERYEFAGVRAVHFLLRDHLDRGVSCTRTYDALGKNVAEFLRARWVDLPVKFLEQGRL